ELVRALTQYGAAFAPASESRRQALAAQKAGGLRGFALLPEIKPIPGGLQLTLIGSSYPDRALLGEGNVRGTGAKPEELIRALVPRAISEAAQTFDWSQP